MGIVKKKMAGVVVLSTFCLTLSLAACAPVEGAGDKQSDGASAQALSAWTIDSDCQSCHNNEVESGSNSSCAYSLHKDVQCVTCHEDSEGTLTAAHERYDTAKQPTKLKKTGVSSEVCLSCHNVADLKAATADVSVLTDENGTVVNPHDLPQTKEHLDAVTCSSCHKMHSEEAVTEVAPQVCIACHHANVYECGTCHD